MTRQLVGRVVIAMVLLSPALLAQVGTVVITPARPNETPRVFALSEWVISHPREYANPFDPDEIAIDGIFTGPGDRRIILPAFWSQPFTDNRFGHHEKRRATPAGAGKWLLRFAPTAPGRWEVKVRVTDRGGTGESQPVSIDVAPDAAARGFVRRSPAAKRYLQFDNGASFFPIGLNIAWPHNDPGLDEYEQWFGKLGSAGGNFARVWMSHPNRMTETTDVGIGRFDLAAMQYYDEILEIARKNGIFVQFTLNNHRDLLPHDQYGDSIWLLFPYSAAHGGPATRPADFITGRPSRDLYKRRLRYIIARYAAYTNLAAWEFFNEQEFTKIDIPTDWLREMSEYVKANDPYGRIVTESSKLPDDQWRLPGIDMTQQHLYVGGSPDLVGPIVAAARRHDKFAKPCAVAEFGTGSTMGEDRADPGGTGTILHQSIWASALAGCAGSSWHWWWDNYVAPKDVWHTYTGLSKFAAEIDWANRNFQPVEIAPPLSPADGSETFFDMSLACSENWGYVPPANVIVGINGTTSAALPHYWVSPTKPNIYESTKLHVELPRATKLTLRVSQVSDVAVMRVSIDDRPVADFPFSALPGAADVKKTAREGTDPKAVYKATLEAERTVDIPAGKHAIGVTTVAGDWVALESIVFKEAQSSRYQLAALALSDATANETIAWFYDTQAHWRNDLAGVKPRQFTSATVEVPVVSVARLKVEWWDTRSGKIVSASTESPAGSKLVLMIPSFSRDIAVRIRPAD